MTTKREMSNVNFFGEEFEIVDKKAREEKLDKSQGVENAGKILGIGPDGNIAPVKVDMEAVINSLFRFSKNGKVYTSKVYRHAVNQTTTCEKLDSNAGLICEPSTDTVEGRDDYEDIPLFKWYKCNYLTDAQGHKYPTAIQFLDDDYTETGSVDVGIIQMAPYVKIDRSHSDYELYSITDSPREGYTLWTEARRGDKEWPYVIHSQCFSGVAEDGLLRSQPGLIPARNNSYSNIITNYGKKGEGCFGARKERNSWQILFNAIKHGIKSSQVKFAGCTNYNYTYTASIQREESDTYFPLTKAQAANLVVGSRVSIGYAADNNGYTNTDRGQTNMHKYADSAKILRIEDIDADNAAVYLDITEGFNTMPVAVTDSLTSQVYLTTMHWVGGATDSVIGHHDGSPVSNTNGKFPYRIQGVEYAVGGYFVSSDVVMDFQSDYSKNVYVCDPAIKRSTSDTTIRDTYTLVGTISAFNNRDGYIGDIYFDEETGVTYPLTRGSGNTTGVGDWCYSGGAGSGSREVLNGGSLGSGSHAGSSYLNCGSRLSNAYWYFLAAD